MKIMSVDALEFIRRLLLQQKYFYINVQVYTCAFGVIQIVIIVIFTRQEHTKSVIIPTIEVGSIFKGSIYPI